MSLTITGLNARDLLFQPTMLNDKILHLPMGFTEDKLDTGLLTQISCINTGLGGDSMPSEYGKYARAASRYCART